jgi:hypothetical protein
MKGCCRSLANCWVQEGGQQKMKGCCRCLANCWVQEGGQQKMKGCCRCLAKCSIQEGGQQKMKGCCRCLTNCYAMLLKTAKPITITDTPPNSWELVRDAEIKHFLVYHYSTNYQL